MSRNRKLCKSSASFDWVTLLDLLATGGAVSIQLTTPSVIGTTCDITDCWMSGNSAGVNGGAIDYEVPIGTPSNVYKGLTSCPPLGYRLWDNHDNSFNLGDTTVSGNLAGVSRGSSSRVATKSRGHNGNGGGVFVQGGADVVFHGSLFVGNAATGSGGGVYVGPPSSTLDLTDCHLEGNVAYSGEQLVMSSGGSMAWHNTTMELNLGTSQVRALL